MVEITQRCNRSEGREQSNDRLELPFELRQKSRLRTHLASGEEAWLLLGRGEILRGGDLLLASGGRVVEVVAQQEKLLHVECDTPRSLARAAYHLGNRHIPVEVGDDYLRLGYDHVLEQMLVGLGAHVKTIEEPFEPEAGAYAGHTHVEDGSIRARIHEYGSRAMARVAGRQSVDADER